MLGDWVIVVGSDGNRVCFKYEDVAYIYQEKTDHSVIYFKNNDQSCFISTTIELIMIEVAKQRINTKINNQLDQIIDTHNNTKI